MHKLLNSDLVPSLELANHDLNVRVERNDFLPELCENEVVFLHLLVLALVVVLVLQNLSDKLMGVALADVLLVVDKLLVELGLCEVLVFPEPGHDRAEGVFLIVQILPQIDHFVFELDHALVVELLVLQTHLPLHQQHGVYALVLFIVAPQLFRQPFRLFAQTADRCKVGPKGVHFPEGSLVEM